MSLKCQSLSGLRQLSVSELTETLEEVETAIRRYSEELIQALALRDELDYEKEVHVVFFFPVSLIVRSTAVFLRSRFWVPFSDN